MIVSVIPVSKPAHLLLCGRELPFVQQADHLGHMLTDKGDMEQEAAVKRAKFIQSSVETREMLKWAAPAEVIKATKIYCGMWILLWIQSLGSWGRQV